MTDQPNVCPKCGRPLPDGQSECPPEWNDGHQMDDRGSFSEAWSHPDYQDE